MMIQLHILHDGHATLFVAEWHCSGNVVPQALLKRPYPLGPLVFMNTTLQHL